MQISLSEHDIQIDFNYEATIIVRVDLVLTQRGHKAKIGLNG